MTGSSTIIVTGGRDFANAALVEKTLNALVPPERRNVNTRIVQGGARGADALARQWALRTGCQSITFDAAWDYHGKSAGFIRNEAMSRINNAKVVAFPGGRGTAHMVRTCRNAGREVIEVSDE